ncbi:MBL fold metallo-hydrolase [Polyangium jinanense]|uniref:MBL fold metallo-hydrolase n=1 Tax=Polyangium jinanense TaxID=2829994 RepID=A0A9X3WZH4_9BACT|nr:MBL fold metallo-hydrolase [Polyangium jinanense]MDC3954978.1 MBL fold metallo-hydrolase [Polyangium jinanense]MDC3981252.1 MBL fold metallo-hydrolase [Polyangium jinanense]
MGRPWRVTLGVERFPALTPTLPPATHTNSYALGEREVLLVEPATPFDDERREWLAWARSLSSHGRHPIGIVLTHHHADHVGGASFFADELRLPLLAHRETAARLAGEVRIDRYIEDGERIVLAGPRTMPLRVLHTPGHAPGHVCLLDEDTGAVIVGDMVASEGTILIEPVDGDMIEYLAQLDRLAGLSASVALPAHGEPIDEPTTLFRRYITHRLAREAKVVAAFASMPPEGASLDALLPVAYADTPPFLWPLARMSLEAHLVKLVREGRVLRTSSGDYRLAPGS